jgi:hypothetical protein
MPIAKPVKKPVKSAKPSKTKGGFNLSPLLSAILLASARLSLGQNKRMDALKTSKSSSKSPKVPKSPKSSLKTQKSPK